MIVTLTMNPSVDRTAHLPSPLAVGGVNRITSVDDSPGGKGVNVARVLAGGGVDAQAVFPAPEDDPFVAMCRASGVATTVVPAGGAVRINLTVADPNGITTKINAPGPEVDTATVDRACSTILTLARDAGWVVLCGSLPRGVPDDFYADLVAELRPAGARLAVDTSDAPLAALAARLPGAAPDLVKPNGDELGQLVGVDGAELERRAADGDTTPVVDAARALRDKGVTTALVTLGGAGAVLVDDGEAWYANTPPVQVRSTVGAGDSALAGYLLAEARGLTPEDRLVWAVNHGSVAASLPGTGLPLGLDPSTFRATVRRLD